MARAHIPDVHADGRWRSADEVDALARRWRAATLDAIGDRHRVIATALPATPEGIGLFIALSALPVPLVLLNPDGAWPRAAFPPDTHVVLAPSLAHLADVARQHGLKPFVLPDPSLRTDAPPLEPLSGPGLIMFTSGSTGAPKPVFRPMHRLLGGAAARAEALGLGSGDGIIVGVTLVHGQGMNMLLTSMLLGGRLGFLPPVNHRAALATLAMPEFTCWRATPHFADMLGRCALTGPAVAPKVCLLSSPIANSVFETFLERFGVPLRQGYSSGETGPIAVDDRPAAAVRPGTVGRLVSRVEVCIGDHPSAPLPSGETGRVWVRSPWQSAGYGFPPDVERPDDVDGWWPTRDLGAFNEDGLLSLAGRMDDCIRTRDGRLVNLAAVADILREIDSIHGVAVVPIDGPAGASLGAVLECDSSVPISTLRLQLSGALPPWARPRKLAIVPSLPRLPNGKPDRQACIAALDREGR
ncbi:MAG TPA: long-chain fatty acid--CoA ligase [Vicinamibacterales bacterium]